MKRSNPDSKLYSKQNLLQELEDPNSKFNKTIKEQYSDPTILSYKKKRLQKLLEDRALDPNEATIISRCPGRISLSKHADYINNDLLYVLDDRDIYLATQKNSQGKLILINQDSQFENTTVDLDQLKQIDKSKWYFYPCKLYSQLCNNGQGLTLVYNSDLPEAAGLSSSHALMVSTAIALISSLRAERSEAWQSSLTSLEARLKHKTKIQELIKLLQEVEHSRGFKSGLGDQTAQLFGKKNHFSFIKLEPNLAVEYQKIPEDLALITVTSSIKADKNLPEFKAANENIKAYKSINDFAKKHNCNYLGDLIYKYNENQIFKILEEIEDHKLRGLALYGLAEATRVRELKNKLNTVQLGRHLNLSHQAEINFKLINGKWSALTEAEKQEYLFDPNQELAKHSGIYHASTLINDQLQAFSNQLDGVYGSSISGAGLGGSNSIICKSSNAKAIEQALSQGFHLDQKLEIHISSSSAAANLLS